MIIDSTVTLKKYGKILSVMDVAIILIKWIYRSQTDLLGEMKSSEKRMNKLYFMLTRFNRDGILKSS